MFLVLFVFGSISNSRLWPRAVWHSTGQVQVHGAAMKIRGKQAKLGSTCRALWCAVLRAGVRHGMGRKDTGSLLSPAAVHGTWTGISARWRKAAQAQCRLQEVILQNR